MRTDAAVANVVKAVVGDHLVDVKLFHKVAAANVICKLSDAVVSAATGKGLEAIVASSVVIEVIQSVTNV